MNKESKKKAARERMQIWIDPKTSKFIRDIQHEKGYRTLGEAVDYIVHESEAGEAKIAVGESLALTISDKVADTLKPLYDVLRIRSGYTDKNLKVMLEVMNSLVFALGVNENKAVTRDIMEAKLIVAAEKRVKEQLDHYAQEKAAREKKKKGESQNQAVGEVKTIHEVIVDVVE